LFYRNNCYTIACTLHCYITLTFIAFIIKRPRGLQKPGELIIFNRCITRVISLIKVGDLYNIFNKKIGFKASNLHKIKSKKLFNYYKRNIIKYIEFFQAANFAFDFISSFF